VIAKIKEFISIKQKTKGIILLFFGGTALVFFFQNASAPGLQPKFTQVETPALVAATETFRARVIAETQAAAQAYQAQAPGTPWDELTSKEALQERIKYLKSNPSFKEAFLAWGQVLRNEAPKLGFQAVSLNGDTLEITIKPITYAGSSNYPNLLSSLMAEGSLGTRSNIVIEPLNPRWVTWAMQSGNTGLAIEPTRGQLSVVSLNPYELLQSGVDWNSKLSRAYQITRHEFGHSANNADAFSGRFTPEKAVIEYPSYAPPGSTYEQ